MGLGIARHRSRYRDLGAWAPIRGKAKVWSWGPTGNVGEGGVFEILGKHMGMICCLLPPLHSAFFFFLIWMVAGLVEKLQKKQEFANNLRTYRDGEKEKRKSTALRGQVISEHSGSPGGDSWHGLAMIQWGPEPRQRWREGRGLKREWKEGKMVWSLLHGHGNFRLGLWCHFLQFIVVAWVVTQGHAFSSFSQFHIIRTLTWWIPDHNNGSHSKSHRN